MIFQGINTNILQSLNNLTNIPWVAKITPILADLPIFFIPIFLVYMWIRYTYVTPNTQKKSDLLTIFYGCVIGILFALIIQHFFHFPRPETALENSGNLLMKHIPDASFPSDHATVAAAFLTGLWLANYKKVFWMILPWFIIMDICRVIAGVHWPADIIMGTAVGILGGYIAHALAIQIKLVKKMNSRIIDLASYFKL